MHPFRRVAVLAISFSIGACSSATGPSDDLTDAIERWAASAPSSYSFIYSQSCECAFGGPIRLTVVGGVVTSFDTSPGGQVVVPDMKPEDFPTIDRLLERLSDVIALDPISFEATYDATLGYPRSVNYDISEMIADDELFFEVSEFEAID